DIYISNSQIRRFDLRNGDKVAGPARPPKSNERYYGLMQISTVNGKDPEEAKERDHFPSLTPLYPEEQIKLEYKQNAISNRLIDVFSPIAFCLYSNLICSSGYNGEYKQNAISNRLIDVFSPIGFGQRGLIVSPPKAGKTSTLKSIANGISHNYPDAELIVMLIDERPEEVTDIERS